MKRLSCKSTYLAIIVAGTALFTCQQVGAQPYQNRAYDKGVRHLANREYDAAINSFDEAIGLDDKNADAYFKRGQCFFKLGNYRLAAGDFTQVILINPDSARAYLWRARAYKKSGQDKLAADDHQKATQLDPRLAGATAKKSNNYQSQKQPGALSNKQKL